MTKQLTKTDKKKLKMNQIETSLSKLDLQWRDLLGEIIICIFLAGGSAPGSERAPGSSGSSNEAVNLSTADPIKSSSCCCCCPEPAGKLAAWESAAATEPGALFPSDAWKSKWGELSSTNLPSKKGLYCKQTTGRPEHDATADGPTYGRTSS